MARPSKRFAALHPVWLAWLLLLVCGVAGAHAGHAHHETVWFADARVSGSSVVAEARSAAPVEIGSSAPCPGDGNGACCCKVIKSSAPAQPKISVARSSYVNPVHAASSLLMPPRDEPRAAPARIAVHARGSRAPPALPV